MRWVRGGLLGAAAALLLGLLPAGRRAPSSPPAAAARIVSRSAEAALGRETAAQVERHYPVDRDPIAVARVRRIGRRLAGSVPNAPFPFEFHVIEDGTVNAFALPGGYIYIFRGLLQLLPSDDALASVLAHEIAHVAERHAVQQFEKNLLLSAALTGILAGTGAGGGFRDAAAVVQALAGLSFSRSDESEADRVGIELLARAGYDPRAAAEAMRVVQRAAAGEGEREPALLRTHPAPEQRIRRLEELAEALRPRREELSAGSSAARPAPPPLPEPEAPAGPKGVRLAPCAWWPLAPGARWGYRVRQGEVETDLTIRVLETVAPGVFRVEWAFGNGLHAVRLVAPAGERLFSASPERVAAGEWRAEAVFDAETAALPEGGALRRAGMERVRVPAGEFEAVRVERLGPEERVEARAWYAAGVGLVRSVLSPIEPGAPETVQELVDHSLPR